MLLSHTTHNVWLWLYKVNIFEFLVEEFRVVCNSSEYEMTMLFKIIVSAAIDTRTTMLPVASYQCKHSGGKTFDYFAIASNVQCKSLISSICFAYRPSAPNDKVFREQNKKNLIFRFVAKVKMRCNLIRFIATHRCTLPPNGERLTYRFEFRIFVLN